MSKGSRVRNKLKRDNIKKARKAAKKVYMLSTPLTAR